MQDNIPSPKEEMLACRRGEGGDKKGKGFAARSKKRTKRLLKRAALWWPVFAILLVWIGIMQFIAADKYEAVATVVGENEQATVDAATDGLDFGSLPAGDSSARFITIENNGNTDMYVKAYEWGAVAKFMEMDRNGFVLKAGESKKVQFLLEIPAGTQAKEYAGGVIIFEVPKIL